MFYIENFSLPIIFGDFNFLRQKIEKKLFLLIPYQGAKLPDKGFNPRIELVWNYIAKNDRNS